MKNKITAAFGNEKLEHWEHITYSQIHVIDLTRKTNSRKGVEIHDTQPEGVATLLIGNPNIEDISATCFKAQCFCDVRGNEPTNCEGVFYLSDSTDKTWILFIEIKDCDKGNIAKYFKDAKKQIISTVQIFRDKQIITEDKLVYANVSFPRADKINFFNHFIKNPEQKKFRDDYKIAIKGTNKLVIKNHRTIS